MLLLLLGLFTAIAVYNFYWKRRGLPPGPPPLPLVGNLLTYARLAPGYEAFKQWRKQYGPVFTYWVGEKPVVVIANYATMQETFIKEGDTFAGRYFFTEGLALLRGSINGIILTEGEEWRTNRRFALQALREFGMGRPEMQQKILVEVDYVIENLKRDLTAGVREHDITMYTDVGVGSIINQMLFGYRFAGGREEEFRRVKFLLDEAGRQMGSPLGAAVLMCPSLRHLPPFSYMFRQMQDTFSALLGSIQEQISVFAANFAPSKESESRQSPFVATYLKHFEETKEKGTAMDAMIYRY